MGAVASPREGLVLAALVVACYAIGACGRSSLDDSWLGLPAGGTSLDGGVVADAASPPCGPSTCVNGCCSKGTCVPFGTPSLAFCGTTGQECIDCSAALGCIGSGGPDGGAYCYRPPVPGCVCPGGCCSADLVCHPGTSNDACGSNQSLCTVCPANAACLVTDTAHDCAPVAPPPPPPGSGCSPCDGCCSAASPTPGAPTACVAGTSNTACGSNGSYCENCAGEGLFCLPVPGHPSERGCFNTGCVPGACDGCCDAAGVCEDGFVDSACGSGGALCTDCGAAGSTCDELVSPRVCTNQQTTCPAPYAGCAPATSTAVPIVQPSACTAGDLAQAAAACSGGALTAACQAFFAAEEANDAGVCAACLAPFDTTFDDGRGVYRCVAPLLDTACNHLTGCAADCETKSCASCAPAEVTLCETQARAPSGYCAAAVDAAGCAESTIQSGFCAPSSYPSFGAWLAAVGAHYCSDVDGGP